MNHDDIGSRIVAAVGELGARELLDALTRAEADRAALIGRLAIRNDAAWLAEVLTDLEVDEIARLHMIEALRSTGDRGRRRDVGTLPATPKGNHPQPGGFVT